MPIPGTRRPAGLEENIGVAAIELTADDLQTIEEAVAQITVHGARRPVQLQHLTER